MSTVITKATLERNLPYFLVQVLRKGLTDTHTPARNGKDWIFKSQPTDDMDMDDLPRITLDASPLSYKNWNISGDKFKNEAVHIECWIMTGGANTSVGPLSDRDSFADAVKNLLFNPTSPDSSGLTLAGNHIVLRSLSSNVSDFFHAHHPKLIRAKTISMDFGYYGG